MSSVSREERDIDSLSDLSLASEERMPERTRASSPNVSFDNEREIHDIHQKEGDKVDLHATNLLEYEGEKHCLQEAENDIANIYAGDRLAYTLDNIDPAAHVMHEEPSIRSESYKVEGGKRTNDEIALTAPRHAIIARTNAHFVGIVSLVLQLVEFVLMKIFRVKEENIPWGRQMLVLDVRHYKSLADLIQEGIHFPTVEDTKSGNIWAGFLKLVKNCDVRTEDSILLPGQLVYAMSHKDEDGALLLESASLPSEKQEALERKLDVIVSAWIHSTACSPTTKTELLMGLESAVASWADENGNTDPVLTKKLQRSIAQLREDGQLTGNPAAKRVSTSMFVRIVKDVLDVCGDKGFDSQRVENVCQLIKSTGCGLDGMPDLVYTEDLDVANELTRASYRANEVRKYLKESLISLESEKLQLVKEYEAIAARLNGLPKKDDDDAAQSRKNIGDLLKHKGKEIEAKNQQVMQATSGSKIMEKWININKFLVNKVLCKEIINIGPSSRTEIFRKLWNSVSQDNIESIDTDMMRLLFGSFDNNSFFFGSNMVTALLSALEGNLLVIIDALNNRGGVELQLALGKIMKLLDRDKDFTGKVSIPLQRALCALLANGDLIERLADVVGEYDNDDILRTWPKFDEFCAVCIECGKLLQGDVPVSDGFMERYRSETIEGPEKPDAATKSKESEKDPDDSKTKT